MKEIWKDIPGYEGYYQASTIGRIRSLDREITNKGSGGTYTLQGKIKKQTPSGKEYKNRNTPS